MREKILLQFSFHKILQLFFGRPKGGRMYEIEIGGPAKEFQSN